MRAQPKTAAIKMAAMKSLRSEIPPLTKMAAKCSRPGQSANPRQSQVSHRISDDHVHGDVAASSVDIDVWYVSIEFDRISHMQMFPLSFDHEIQFSARNH